MSILNYINKNNQFTEICINCMDKINQFAEKPELINCTDIFDSGIIRNLDNVDKIIIHHDSIPQAYKAMIVEINEFHKKEGLKTIAYHFWIDKYGTIYQCHNLNETTSHCLGQNAKSIGICLNGEFNSQKITEQQEKSLIKLLNFLTSKYSISIDNIFGHRDFRRTDCPGQNIDIEQIKVKTKNIHFLNDIIK